MQIKKKIQMKKYPWFFTFNANKNKVANQQTIRPPKTFPNTTLIGNLTFV